MKKPLQISSRFPRFKRVSLVDMVFESIKDEIVSGKFVHDEKLPSQEIFSKELGVSRTVVREAWNKLASVGLVKIIHGHGSFVSFPDTDYLLEPIYDAIQLNKNTTQELFESRFYLEIIIVRLAAKRRKQSDITMLYKLVDEMEINSRKNDIAQIVQSDIEFHQALADISRNMVLKQFLLTIRKMIQNFLEDYTKIPGTPQSAIKYHTQIIKAIDKKDPILAQSTMELHLMNVIETMNRTLNLTLDF